MSLVDSNGNPMPQDQASEPQVNGQTKKDLMDVRTMGTGLLIYNLIRATGEEMGIGNAIQQLHAMKQQQKMVADPPQLVAMEAHLKNMERVRYVIANEINLRFADVDANRRDKLGLTAVEPSPI